MKQTGSPPHTRGKLTVFPFISYFYRITPAYAGKTLSNTQKNKQTQDHPRIRGENGAKDRIAGCATGSPPHTRGKLTDRKSVV